MNLTPLALIFVALLLNPLQLNAEITPTERDERRTHYDGKALSVPIQDDHMIELYQRWIDTGISSLFAAMAQQKLKQEPSAYARKHFFSCSREAETLKLHARCLSKLMKSRFGPTLNEAKRHPNRPPRLNRYLRPTVLNGNNPQNRWIGAFRTADKNERQRRKRAVRELQQYELKTPKEVMSPLGSIAKYLLNDLLQKQNKTKTKDWKETVERMRHNTALKRQLEADRESEEFEEQMAPVGMLRKLSRIGGKEENLDIDSFLEDKQEMKKQLKKMHKKKGKAGGVERIFKLVRQGLKLGYSLSGKNSSDFDEKNTRVLSPKFLSVAPESLNETEKIDFLSPSLFSLHDKGEGLEKLTSLPQLLNGFTTKEQDLWMNYILEAAGVNDEADRMENDLKEPNKTSETIDLLRAYKQEGFTKDGTPLYFTRENITDKYGGDGLKQKADHFEKLSQMYTKEQLLQMNQTGFAFMTPKQLKFMYGPRSPYKNTERLQFFSQLNETNMKSELSEEVHRMADRKSFSIRQKDIILSPVLFTPIVLMPAILSQAAILSPILFSPAILSPAIFGTVLLSPWMFIPVILSPRVLSPLILSPFMFSPLILSPVALHPAILSPGLFNPIILTPFVLTPFILSPQVFTPLILAPFALSPLILSPLVGSPLILNPFVLSPGILSPGYLGGLILSPCKFTATRS